MDNWYNETDLAYSAGIPAIKLGDGHLVCNIRDAALEKAMNEQHKHDKDNNCKTAVRTYSLPFVFAL